MQERNDTNSNSNFIVLRRCLQPECHLSVLLLCTIAYHPLCTGTDFLCPDKTPRIHRLIFTKHATERSKGEAKPLISIPILPDNLANRMTKTTWTANNSSVLDATLERITAFTSPHL